MNILDQATRELIEICQHCYRTADNPPTRLSLSAAVRGGHQSQSVIAALLAYEVVSPTLAPITADMVSELLESIVSSLTRFPSNPDGPIRRYSEGTFLGGSEGPIVTGMPTERLAWFSCYYLCRDARYITVKPLLDQVGGSPPH